MARLYTNENIALQVAQELSALGHDVLTSYDAGNANRSVEDPEVLAFATAQNRILLTYNRRHFLRLHNSRNTPHAGIVLCTVDPDYAGQARRIHAALQIHMRDRLVRVNRP